MKHSLILMVMISCSHHIGCMHYSTMQDTIKQRLDGAIRDKQLSECAQNLAPLLSVQDMTNLITEMPLFCSYFSPQCLHLLINTWQDKIDINLTNNKSPKSRYVSSILFVVLMLAAGRELSVMYTTLDRFKDRIDINLKDHNGATPLETLLDLNFVIGHDIFPHLVNTCTTIFKHFESKISHQHLRDIEIILAPHENDSPKQKNIKLCLLVALPNSLASKIKRLRCTQFTDVIILTQQGRGV